MGIYLHMIICTTDHASIQTQTLDYMKINANIYIHLNIKTYELTHELTH